jgi:ATP-dependent Clp protease ATP-binding subunit ClpA
MVFERFTPMARRVMMVAQEGARHRRRQLLGTDDLLAALAEPNGTSSSQALEHLGVTAADITSKVKRAGWRSSPSHVPLAADTKRAIEAAMREADNRGEDHVGSAHLLLGLVAERHGDGGRVISEIGLTYSAVLAALGSLAEPESAVQHTEVVSRLREREGQDQVKPQAEATEATDCSDPEAEPLP